ncbi:thioesterase II family protein [Streptomyces griseorubiginosus]|uniref:thioesterase II family protein n=1 Tax=Streptomyces griseorubiginosus TaxID=67304 RepID=UPI003AF3A7A6
MDVTGPDSPAAWFRVHRRSVEPRLRLVCFPHAGGTAQLFHGWPARLPKDIEVLAVRYPGRQDRLAEPCVEDMATLADRITRALVPYLDRPVALFGHSMGSAVAYEVALRLESRHGTTAARLMVSGRAAPHRAPRGGLHEDDDDALIAGVRTLGSLGSEVFDIPELRELLLPALRADYRLIETYRPSDPAPVRAPVSAYIGDSDPGSGQERASVAAWAELTTAGDFTLRSFPGDHFYLDPCEAELTADIAHHLEGVGRNRKIIAFP